MRPRPFVSLVGLTLLIAAAAWAQSSSTSNRERRFFSARDGVGIDAPAGWALSTHTGYPTVLVTLVHPGGARISIAVDQTKLATAAAFADQNRAGLIAQGFTLERVGPGPHGGIRIDARAPQRKQVVRQLYIVRDLPSARDRHQAIVVSLAAPGEQAGTVGAAFDWALAHLTLEAPVRSEEDKADAGR